MPLRLYSCLIYVPLCLHTRILFPVGGSNLYIETVLKKTYDPNSTEGGGIEITGNLGAVMKESVQLAYTFAKAYLIERDPSNNFLQKAQLHLHVPEVGALEHGYLHFVIVFKMFACCHIHVLEHQLKHLSV